MRTGIQTKVMNRVQTKSEETRLPPRRAAKQLRSETPCSYMPSHAVYAQMVGWNHFDGLTRALISASESIRGFEEDAAVSYTPRPLKEYAIEAPDFETIDDDGLAAYILELEDAIRRVKSAKTLPMVYARNAENDYKAISQAIETITKEGAIAAIREVYSDALHYASENARAYNKAEESLLAQLEEAKAHVRTPTDFAHDIEELRRQVDELMAK